MTGDDALEGLYPFLTPGSSLVPSSEALVASVRGKADAHQSVIAAFMEANAGRVVAAAEGIADVYCNGGRLFTMGNGGSSCDAAHVAVEFLHPVTAGRPALEAVNLVADTAMLTAVGNDVGFDHVFVRQLVARARPGDGLIGLSTSGNSANLLRAFAKAKELGLVTVGLAGMSGGEMAAMGLDHCLVVETDSIHRIQECHVLIYHVLRDLVHTMLAGSRGRPSGE